MAEVLGQLIISDPKFRQLVGSPTSTKNTGAKGPTGDKGERGEKGPTGDVGQRGPQGLAGPNGDKGEQGDKGPPGNPGRDGRDGTNGRDGDNGAPGAPGIPGRRGPTGWQGPRGAEGPRGPAGPAGPAGPGVVVRPPDAVEGIDWREHRLNPTQLDDAMVPAYRSIHPWIWKRPETGSEVNYGIPLEMWCTPKATFMSNFSDGWRIGVDVGDPKTFLYGFPTLPTNASNGQIFHFLSSVSHYCCGYSIYVPPLHTLTAHDPHGRWAADLTAQYQAVFDYHNSVLLQGFKSKAANLSYTDRLAHLLRDHDSYSLYYQLAEIAGHPALVYGTPYSRIPSQRNDTTLTEYRDDWLQHLYTQYLRGTFYSDRYFVEEFAKGLNHVYSTTLRPHLISILRIQPINKPVTRNFWPVNILQYLATISTHVGISKLDLASTPREFDSKRKGTATSTGSRRQSSVRQIGADDAGPSLFNQVNALDFLDADDLAFVLQVSAQNSRQCDLCRSSDHLLAGCPQLQIVKNDQHRLRRLLGALRSAYDSSRPSPQGSSRPSGTPARPGTPTRDNRRPLPVRQVSPDDDTDNESLLNQVESSSLVDTDEEPDF